MLEECSFLILPSSALFTCVSQEEEVGSCKRIICLGWERCHLKYLASRITILLAQIREQQNGAFYVSARKDWVFPSCRCEIKLTAARKGEMLMSSLRLLQRLTAESVVETGFARQGCTPHPQLWQPRHPPFPCQPVSLKSSHVSSGPVPQLWLHPQWKGKGLCLQMQ